MPTRLEQAISTVVQDLIIDTQQISNILMQANLQFITHMHAFASSAAMYVVYLQKAMAKINSAQKQQQLNQYALVLSDHILKIRIVTAEIDKYMQHALAASNVLHFDITQLDLDKEFSTDSSAQAYKIVCDLNCKVEVLGSILHNLIKHILERLARGLDIVEKGNNPQKIEHAAELKALMTVFNLVISSYPNLAAYARESVITSRQIAQNSAHLAQLLDARFAEILDELFVETDDVPDDVSDILSASPTTVTPYSEYSRRSTPRLR